MGPIFDGINNFFLEITAGIVGTGGLIVGIMIVSLGLYILGDWWKSKTINWLALGGGILVIIVATIFITQYKEITCWISRGEWCP